MRWNGRESTAPKVALVLALTAAALIWATAGATASLPPKAPTGLTDSAVNSTGFTVSWRNPPGTLTGDNITLYTGGCLGVLSVTKLGVVTAYSFSGLNYSTEYCVTVDASNATGQGHNATPYLNVTTLPIGGGGFGSPGLFNFAPLVLLALALGVGAAILYKTLGRKNQ